MHAVSRPPPPPYGPARALGCPALLVGGHAPQRARVVNGLGLRGRCWAVKVLRMAHHLDLPVRTEPAWHGIEPPNLRLPQVDTAFLIEGPVPRPEGFILEVKFKSRRSGWWQVWDGGLGCQGETIPPGPVTHFRSYAHALVGSLYAKRVWGRKLSDVRVRDLSTNSLLSGRVRLSR